MSVQDLALQRNKYKHLSDEEWRWFLQQVEGRERTADKLPTFASIEDWWYPVRLSCEQCSSEATARYKASLCQPAGRSLLDLTGGYGVDTYFLSELFDQTDYVEQNAELCRIAEHNFSLPFKGEELCSIGRPVDGRRILLGLGPICVHNTTAEEFLHRTPDTVHPYSLIFLDPARRDSHGGKVFRLADCTPNVVELLPTLLSHLAPDGRILLKLSPMLDLTQAIKELAAIRWDAHIVAVKNEVKEVLLLSGGSGKITAIDLAYPEQAFTFTREEESVNVSGLSVKRSVSEAAYLYEPNAAILKAGAYKLVGERFGVQKLDVNTHLYCSETLVPDFPGRIWKAVPIPSAKEKEISQANVLVRNYPLTAEQLKKKLHLRDGGTAYVIGCRVAGKPTVFLADRLQ